MMKKIFAFFFIMISILTPGWPQTSEDYSGFVWIEPGFFRMGTDDGEFDEKPMHWVRISSGFYISDHEVTVGEYLKFVKATGHRTPKCSKKYENWDKPDRADHPVNCVSWDDAQAYITWLNEEEGSLIYRLPTEAQWEYVERAGTMTIYSWGDKDPICEKEKKNGARFDDNKQCNNVGTEAVKSYPANPWGLYDMHGNLWEWVEDWYGEYPEVSVVDPKGFDPSRSLDGSWRGNASSIGFRSRHNSRVTRGGSWNSGALGLSSASRHSNRPNRRNRGVGFRVLRIR